MLQSLEDIIYNTKKSLTTCNFAYYKCGWKRAVNMKITLNSIITCYGSYSDAKKGNINKIQTINEWIGERS